MFNIPEDAAGPLARKLNAEDAWQKKWDDYYDRYQEWAEETESICRTLGVLTECLKNGTEGRKYASIRKVRDELDVLFDRLFDHIDYLPEEPDE